MKIHPFHIAIFAAAILIAVVPGSVFAQGAGVTQEEQCYDTLKANMAETSLWNDALSQIATTTYADLAFSPKYKNLSSFGIETDQGVITMRLFSFGRQTGYQHPPEFPFPSSYKSDEWTTPSKEYIIAEEYVTDPQGSEHFLDCAFIQIASDDLMGVTRDRYFYDGAGISLTKDASDGSYKAWYSENPSFDYQDKPFVTWKRLFIYPQSTRNSYFDKYDVADAYPANKVSSLDVLGFLANSPIQVEDYNRDTGTSTIKYLVQDARGNVTQVDPPAALMPVAPTGIDIPAFPLASYYQAIENQFPDFAKLLSIRGSLKYDTFKQLIIEPNLNPEVGKFLSALTNYQQLASYYLAKQQSAKNGMTITNPDLDGLLYAMQNGDAAVQALENGATLATLKDYHAPVQATSFRALAGYAAVTILLLGGVGGFLFWRKKSALINPSV